MKKIVFIIYGDSISHLYINEQVVRMMRNLYGDMNANINFDVVFVPAKVVGDAEQVDVDLLKISAINSAQLLSDAARTLTKIQGEVTYSVAILIHSKCFDNSSNTVANLVLDFSLPSDYLYLSYDADIDFGYSSDWFLGAPNLIAKFERFDVFVKKCISGENSYLESFTRSGWPLTVNTSYYSILTHNALTFLNKVLNYSIFTSAPSFLGQFFVRKVSGLSKKIVRRMIRRERIAEIHGKLSDCPAQQVYSEDLAWNLRPLVKYFIYEEGLRQHLRFLDSNDFNSVTVSLPFRKN